jgi:hypothetical protein
MADDPRVQQLLDELLDSDATPEVVCGASMNPARSLAPAVVSWGLDDLGIYLAAPPLGAGLAAHVYASAWAGEKLESLLADAGAIPERLREFQAKVLEGGGKGAK